jgi:KDO2-lipid IV(A) lauroyltransferase
MTLYALYRIGVALALALPLKVSYAIASALAGIYCRISAKDRKAVIANIRVVIGGGARDRDLEKMSTEVFVNFAKYLVDFFRFSRIDADYIKRSVRIVGAENIGEALSGGKGAILLSAHIGNWELGGAALSLSGYPVSAVVLTHRNGKINEFFTRQRLIGGMRPIEIGPSLKACYCTLTGNGLLALLGDRDFTKNGMTVDLFGRPTQVPKGPALLACRLGAAILPTFMVRLADDSFMLSIDKPILADTSLDENAAVRQIAGRYMKAIETYVQEYPTQWYVFRELWRADASKPVRPDTVV